MFSMPERAILPKPLQKPHPPMWVAVTSPGTEVDAADRGLGCLGLSPGGFADSEKKVLNYRKRIEVCDPVGAFVNDKVLTVNFLSCNEDGDLGRRNGLKVASMFSYMAASSSRQGGAAHALVPLRGAAARTAPRVGQPGRRRQVLQGRHHGTPDDVADAITAWENVGFDGINFIHQFMEVIPQQYVLDSMRSSPRRSCPASRRGRRPGRRRRRVVRSRQGCLMPLAGSLDIRPLVDGAPEVVLDDHELKVDDVDILQVLYEIRVDDREALVPPASTRPSRWSSASSSTGRRERVRPLRPGPAAPDRPLGRRPRCYLISARCDNPELAEVLAGSWGFRVSPGEISLRRFHDRVDCSVHEDGRLILQTSLVDPVPVTGHDVQYPPGMHLARVTRDGSSSRASCRWTPSTSSAGPTAAGRS